MPSGFGTIYATNITPDPDNGIGRWSADEFWNSLHDGVRRDGQQLYPAMPYTSYRGMTRADADSIYAYLMQLKPMKVANVRTELGFPYNIRLGMMGWNLLFLADSLPATSTGSSAAWQRGRYLVDVLGHCGECHAPRGIVGQMELSRSLTGFALGRVAAPDITPAGLTARGWTGAALRTYLGRGTGLGLCRHAPGRDAQHAEPDGGGSCRHDDLSTARRCRRHCRQAIRQPPTARGGAPMWRSAPAATASKAGACRTRSWRSEATAR